MWQTLTKNIVNWLLLGLILIVALWLRLWGIRFGLPYIYHYDEHFYVNTALKLGQGILANPPYAPTGLANIFFVEYAGYFIWGKIFGSISSGSDFEAIFRSDPSTFYIIARATSGVLGVITVAALYELGKLISNLAVGLTAAAFLSVSFLHVRDSHYAVPDVAMTAFILLAVTLAAVGMNRNERKYLYLAAISGGLAVAVKWTALPVAVVIAWASLWTRVDEKKSFLTRFWAPPIFISAFFFIVGFALGAPQMLLEPMPFIAHGSGQLHADKNGGFELWQVDTLSGWLFYGKTLVYGMSIPLLGLGVIGMIRQLYLVLKTANKSSILLLLFPLIYYLLMGSTRHYFARYAIPLVPFLALFAADVVIATALGLKHKQPQLAWGVAAILILLVMVQPLRQSIQHNTILSQEDTRTLAKDWIESNIPAGTKIAVDWDTHGPPLSTTEKTVPYSHQVFDVTQVGETGLFEHPLSWYQQQGYDYLITSSFIYDIPLVFKAENEERQAFYKSLDQNLELVQEFRPNNSSQDPPFIFDELYGPAISLWTRERPGPVIKVYKLNQFVSKTN